MSGLTLCQAAPRGPCAYVRVVDGVRAVAIGVLFSPGSRARSLDQETIPLAHEHGGLATDIDPSWLQRCPLGGAVDKIGARYVIVMRQDDSEWSLINQRGDFKPELFSGISSIGPDTPGFTRVLRYGTMTLYRIDDAS